MKRHNVSSGTAVPLPHCVAQQPSDASRRVDLEQLMWSTCENFPPLCILEMRLAKESCQPASSWQWQEVNSTRRTKGRAPSTVKLKDKNQIYIRTYFFFNSHTMGWRLILLKNDTRYFPHWKTSYQLWVGMNSTTRPRSQTPVLDRKG